MSLILAIETSCDETAAAVIEDGHRIRSNVVASQIELHRPYGGVFPEVASRQHPSTSCRLSRRASTAPGTTGADLDALAVTRGPGLAGSLLVGVNAAKALAWGRSLPIIAANHLEGHLYSNWLDEGGKIDSSGYHSSDPSGVRCRGPRLSAVGADCLRRTHRDHPDARSRTLPATGRDDRRRGGGGVRQSGSTPGVGLSGRAGDPEGRRRG